MPTTNLSGTCTTTMPATTPPPPQSKHLVRLMERLRERGSLDVYDAGFTEVYLAVPWSRVRHFPLVARGADALPFALPASAERVRRSFGSCLVLCPDDGACGGGSCARGADCPMVHADVSGLTSRGVHVHASWPSLGAVPYRRVAESVAGAFGISGDDAMVEVLQPNERQPADVVRADRLLLTAGALAAAEGRVAAVGAPHAAVSRCAHFHFNWMCNRGESCRFVHVVHIDSDTGDSEESETTNCSDATTTSLVAFFAGLRQERPLAPQSGHVATIRKPQLLPLNPTGLYSVSPCGPSSCRSGSNSNSSNNRSIPPRCLLPAGSSIARFQQQPIRESKVCVSAKREFSTLCSRVSHSVVFLRDREGIRWFRHNPYGGVTCRHEVFDCRVGLTAPTCQLKGTLFGRDSLNGS